jgi:hypothetical protein
LTLEALKKTGFIWGNATNIFANGIVSEVLEECLGLRCSVFQEMPKFCCMLFEIS